MLFPLKRSCWNCYFHFLFPFFQFTFATLRLHTFYHFSYLCILFFSLPLDFFLIINIFREIRQKEIYKMIIDTNPLYINKFFRTVSKFRCAWVNVLIISSLSLPYSLRKFWRIQIWIPKEMFFHLLTTFNLCRALIFTLDSTFNLSLTERISRD